MTKRADRSTPRLLWDVGTAYDFFQSLTVLHFPEKFGIRKAWTAGVRARLSPASRETLEVAQNLFYAPIHWIYTLPEPKNAETVLWSLARVPPPKRLFELAFDSAEASTDVAITLTETAARGAWDEEDRDRLRTAFTCTESGKCQHSDEKLASMLGAWANAESFGEALLPALRNYNEVFFAEEERRIAPALARAVESAQALADKLSFADLVEEISGGLRFDGPMDVEEIVLAPSYWLTPLAMWNRVSSERMYLTFGARPADASVIPGETVPDALLRPLKALSDPTRLKILRLLAEKQIAAAEMARELRLRAPTVSHHLHALRVAGLIQITVPSADGRETTRYALRPNALADVFETLNEYLLQGVEEDEH